MAGLLPIMNPSPEFFVWHCSDIVHGANVLLLAQFSYVNQGFRVPCSTTQHWQTTISLHKFHHISHPKRFRSMAFHSASSFLAFLSEARLWAAGQRVPFPAVWSDLSMIRLTTWRRWLATCSIMDKIVCLFKKKDTKKEVILCDLLRDIGFWYKFVFLIVWIECKYEQFIHKLQFVVHWHMHTPVFSSYFVVSSRSEFVVLQTWFFSRRPTTKSIFFASLNFLCCSMDWYIQWKIGLWKS